MHNLSYIDHINQAPGLALVKDMESKILACSPCLAGMLGFKSSDEIVGFSDYDLRCDAVKGAKQFIAQDQKAFLNGSHKAIDAYHYADGFFQIIYQEKKATVVQGKTIGLSLYGYELPKAHQFNQQFMSLLENDRSLLDFKLDNNRSYTIYEAYPNSQLTQKESLCLYYVIRGKNNREISELLSLSCRTIEGKIARIKCKLSCCSRNQLIEKAINEGYLSILIEQLFKNKSFSCNLT